MSLPKGRWAPMQGAEIAHGHAFSLICAWFRQTVALANVRSGATGAGPPEFRSVCVLANLRHLYRIHAAAIDLDPGEGYLYLAKVRWRELDLDRVHVLAQ